MLKAAPGVRPVAIFEELCRRHPSVLTHSFSTRREVFFQRALGTCILLEDDIGFGGPLEGLRFGVALGEPGLDGSLEFGDALEYAAADLLAGDFGEQPLDQVDPGRRCWCEVQLEARMLGEPSLGFSWAVRFTIASRTSALIGFLPARAPFPLSLSKRSTPPSM